jgi:5-methylcytosine-specific restriction endonuclease McrA
MDARVYAEVEERAGGCCESCGLPFGIGLKERPEADHFFGRAKAPESIENVWLIHSKCHRDKTDSFPTAAVWLLRFANHCIKFRYEEAAQRAKDKLSWLTSKGVTK